MKNKHPKERSLAPYDIPFFGLKKGAHYFTYKINGEFFTNFEESPLQDADLTVELEFQKNKDNLFELFFDISGMIQVPCDRCLAPLPTHIETSEDVLVKIGNIPGNATNDDLDIMYLSPDMTHFNVAQLIYEFVVLNMPLQNLVPLDPMGNRMCPPDANGKMPCDEDALAALERTNNAAFQAEIKDPIDPRWAALGKLKDEN